MKVRFAVAPGGPCAGIAELVSCADELERSALDGIWLSDLPLGAAIDPLIGLALVAGRTRRLKLGANLVPRGRHPFVLAKGLAQLDEVSNGRLLLALVPGITYPGASAAMGLGTAMSGGELEEILELLRAWWSGQAVDHRSPRWTFTASVLSAKPRQAPLELWLGGRGPTALERAGRIADGWLGAELSVIEAKRARERIEAAAGAAGRVFDPEHFGISIPYARSESALDNATRPRRKDIDPRELLPIGREKLRALLAGYQEAGLSKFVLRPAVEVGSWTEEVAWLEEAVLDLQTPAGGDEKLLAS